MGARVVEGTGLENRQGFTLLVGSNPTPSASNPISSNYTNKLKYYMKIYPQNYLQKHPAFGLLTSPLSCKGC